MSGFAASSHESRFGNRALMELTLKVAMEIMRGIEELRK
jgi:hypothetical protein